MAIGAPMEDGLRIQDGVSGATLEIFASDRPLLAQSGRSRATSTTYFQARVIGISPGGADK
jgi:hypothetical protein